MTIPLGSVITLYISVILDESKYFQSVLYLAVWKWKWNFLFLKPNLVPQDYCNCYNWKLLCTSDHCSSEFERCTKLVLSPNPWQLLRCLLTFLVSSFFLKNVFILGVDFSSLNFRCLFFWCCLGLSLIAVSFKDNFFLLILLSCPSSCLFREGGIFGEMGGLVSGEVTAPPLCDLTQMTKTSWGWPVPS